MFMESVLSLVAEKEAGKARSRTGPSRNPEVDQMAALTE
jgi:hypothetical protein